MTDIAETVDTYLAGWNETDPVLPSRDRRVRLGCRRTPGRSPTCRDRSNRNQRHGRIPPVAVPWPPFRPNQQS